MYKAACVFLCFSVHPLLSLLLPPFSPHLPQLLHVYLPIPVPVEECEGLLETLHVHHGQVPVRAGLVHLLVLREVVTVQTWQVVGSHRIIKWSKGETDG